MPTLRVPATWFGLLAALLLAAPATAQTLDRPDAAATKAAPAAAAAPVERIGAAKPRVVIEEYADFQCPFCAAQEMNWGTQLRAWLAKQKDVRFDYYDLALDQHAFGIPAARAARCAAEQGAFPAARHEIFARQNEWVAAPDPVASVQAIARATTPDAARFDACLHADTTATTTILRANLARARSLHFPGTPTFYVRVGNSSAMLTASVRPDSLARVIADLRRMQ
ncbi:MAG TPA: thioredoxin domain-containing protein [Longimicrobiales bacterium]|nr:thioredoxin domain-containing protein [Longimicrobiales bacterium]